MTARRLSAALSHAAILVAAVVLALLTSPGVARADHTELRLGILAYRPMDVEERDWAPVIDALQRRLPGVRLHVRLLDYTALDTAVRARELDAVITNPGHYVALRYSDGLSTVLAAVTRRRHGIETEAFGGTVLVRADSPLQRWQDLRGKRVGVPHEESLGGWHLQRYELRRRGVRDNDITWVRVGMPHDRVVQAVLDGQVDAGFVRDGVLETMLATGRVTPDRLRVLQRQDLPGYPVAVSTPLVPEWPVATLPHVDSQTRRALLLALLGVRDDPALRTGELAGFVLPQGYVAVEDLLRELRVRPFGVPQLTWRETVQLNAGPLT
ncbi:MAG: phosphate/phosphite/phosphonate ABC transporter substrate-binding protein, partial [Tepidimonas fonticaldi]|nr:phosphate/phosphite/phosphonate ABC transporter substrate-binding protein [Tepidimonas fonticaldi]